MQAIITKYHGPGNIRGSRISATASAGRIYVEYDDSKNLEQNHEVAALALSRKMQWTGDLISGGLPKGSLVWVFKN